MVGTPFEKGKSGNPGGRPKMPTHVKELARVASEHGMQRAIALMDSEDENVALKAINTVFDRAWGKAPQAVTGEDGEGPVEVNVTLSDIDRAKALAALVAKAQIAHKPNG